MNTRLKIASALVVPAVAVGLAACGGSSPASTSSAAATTAASTPLVASSSVAAYQLIPDLVEKVAPSIVSVITDTGQGSGVVYDAAKGIVVTNNHVVQGASQVELVLANGDRAPAQVRATDPATDLAVLQTDAKGLTAVPFAEQLPRVGELAIAVGNPLGFENTVTAGIVSALHRSLDETTYVDLIQTDAPISPGNSGGALINEQGQVIGINSAGIPATENANSLGFAIPSPTVLRVVEQLLQTGTAQQPLLGIRAGELTADERAELGVDGGVKVESVDQGSAAAAAGLEPGDVVVELGGQPVTSMGELLSALRSHAPGDQVSVVVLRNGERVELTATLGSR